MSGIWSAPSVNGDGTITYTSLSNKSLWTPLPPLLEVNIDTYTLIPHGKGWSFDGHEWINKYLVQHDQSGETIPWLGIVEERYYEWALSCDSLDVIIERDLSLFETFLSNHLTKSWKKSQISKLRDNVNYDAILNAFEGTDLHINSCEKENNMITAKYAVAAVAPVVSEEAKQREYLSYRLDDIYVEKRDELRTFFKLDPVDAPKTLREAIEMLKSGDYTAEDKTLDTKQHYISDAFARLRWTKEKPDQAGFEAACDKLSVALTKTQDKIKILDPKEGLAALEAFEAETFH